MEQRAHVLNLLKSKVSISSKFIFIVLVAGFYVKSYRKTTLSSFESLQNDIHCENQGEGRRKLLRGCYQEIADIHRMHSAILNMTLLLTPSRSEERRH